MGQALLGLVARYAILSPVKKIKDQSMHKDPPLLDAELECDATIGPRRSA